MVTEIDPIVESHEKRVRISTDLVSGGYEWHEHAIYSFPMVAALLFACIFKINSCQ